nr:zinc finger, CCHC-type [Tanacetum cinerariifolium]
MKHISSNFAKLDKFEGVDFKRWWQKMHFLLSSMSVVYVFTTLISEDGENSTVEQLRKRAKFQAHLKTSKKELSLFELGIRLCIEESLRVHDNDKPKGNNVAGPSVVNMMKHNNSFRNNDNMGKCRHQDTKYDPNKKSKVTCWKCGKPRHLKKDCKGGKVGNKANVSRTNG